MHGTNVKKNKKKHFNMSHSMLHVSERDLQVLGVRNWRELVADRKKWKDIV